MNALPPQEPHRTTANFAGSGATVGVQADRVDNVHIHQGQPETPPHEKYAEGVRCLAEGNPAKARQLIGEAVTAGHDNAAARFHWLLAILSKRSYRDLSREERVHLHHVAANAGDHPDDEYKAALDAVRELVSHLESGEDDYDRTEKRILELPGELRQKIDRHLDLVLAGATKDKLWQERRRKAETDRHGNDRVDRVWAYFHPRPIPPRVLAAIPPRFSETDHLTAVAATVASAIPVGYLGWLAVSSLDPLPILAYLLTIAAGYAAVTSGFDWRYRVRRIESEHLSRVRGHSRTDPRGSGFSGDVSHSFAHYFSKYRPDDLGPEDWRRITARVRAGLCDEIAHIYRESRIPVGRVNWLIAYLARNARDQWRRGSLYAYPEQYRVKGTTIIQCVLSSAVAVLTTATVLSTAIPAAPFYAVLAMIAAAVTGPFAARRWEYIAGERRRYLDERVEVERDRSRRSAEYLRWKTKLDTTRPSETEMETWLHSDRTALIAEALEHYRLSWSDLISHAVLQGRVVGSKRARKRSGPWRFSRYDLRLFLITVDGVREISTDLDFETGCFEGQQRDNYRFDAMTSVSVTQYSEADRTVHLTLTNGPSRTVTVGEAEDITFDDDESADDQVTINLDASGFTHALQLLESIAAEGKAWAKGGSGGSLSPPGGPVPRPRSTGPAS